MYLCQCVSIVCRVASSFRKRTSSRSVIDHQLRPVCVQLMSTRLVHRVAELSKATTRMTGTDIICVFLKPTIAVAVEGERCSKNEGNVALNDPRGGLENI